MPANPISKDGTIALSWAEPFLELDRENFVCQVTTYQSFNT